jgi:hypothetical protein
MTATQQRLLSDLENQSLRFTTKQAGYGRQHLYVEGYHLMDVFPNIKEHFGIVHEDDSFYDEETDTYHNGNGNEIDEDFLYSLPI